MRERELTISVGPVPGYHVRSVYMVGYGDTTSVGNGRSAQSGRSLID
jgi:hypothetical protein